MAIYHFVAKTGTRSGGQSARAKHDYIAREGSEHEHRDPRLHVESGHMPAFAAANAALYWQAADDHERANGRLFKHLEIALPRDLTFEQNVALVREFASKLTTGVDGGNLPHTLTMHAGGGGNPHADLMISERVNDAIDRGPELWFARAASGAKPAAEGGAKKTDALKPKEWLQHARELWAGMANEALAKAGHEARIDHRTLAAQREEALAMGDHDRAQQLDREPGQHLGPKAHGYEQRTGLKSGRRRHNEARRSELRATTARASQLDHSIERTRAEISEGQRMKEAMAKRIATENLAAGKPSNTPAKAATRPVGASKPSAGTPGPSRTPARSSARPVSKAPRTSTKGLPKWARDAIEDMEKLAKALHAWMDAMRERLNERNEAAKKAAAKKATPPKREQPARTEERPPAPTRKTEAEKRDEAKRRVERALTTGKGATSALVDALRHDPGKVGELLKRGADPMAKGGEAMNEAAKRDPAKLRELVQSMVSNGTVRDHVNLRDLGAQLGPEAKQQLEAMAKEAKAGGLTGAGFKEPAAGPKASMASPGMGGPSGGGGKR